MDGNGNEEDEVFEEGDGEGTVVLDEGQGSLSLQQQKALFAERLVRSFLPFKLLLLCAGRFPLTCVSLDTGSPVFEMLYEWDWKRPQVLYFLALTALIAYLLLQGTFNLFAILLDLRVTGSGPGLKANQTLTLADFDYEKTLVQRHMVLLILIWATLAHSLFSSLSLIFKRKYLAQYFSFWTKAVQKLHMDLAEGLLLQTILISILFLSVITVLVALSIFQFTPTPTSTPTLMGIIMFREYLGPLYRLNRTGLNVPSLVMELYFVGRTFAFGNNVEDSVISGGQYFVRPNDWAAASALFLLNASVLLLVSWSGSEVGGEAGAALDILRRQALLGRQTDTQLLFTLDLFRSYTASKTIDISGAGFFGMTRGFMAGTVSTILAYFIIIFQFQPSLDVKTKGDFELREVLGKFLTKAEGIRPPNHYAFQET